MASAPFDLAELQRRMQGAIASLKHELGGLRTGRASAGLVEPIHVDAYGQSMPLNQVASISIPEPRMISIQVWDRSMVGAVEKAIRDSNLGLSPNTEGQTLRIRIPELNEQRRKELVKVARQMAEDGRVAIRNVRRDVMHHLKELVDKGEVGSDEERRAEERVQKLTDDHTHKIDDLLKRKEEEILEV